MKVNQTSMPLAIPGSDKSNAEPVNGRRFLRIATSADVKNSNTDGDTPQDEPQASNADVLNDIVSGRGLPWLFCAHFFPDLPATDENNDARISSGTAVNNDPIKGVNRL
jgi:hypothetical protein